jgi:hypothetical protein
VTPTPRAYSGSFLGWRRRMDWLLKGVLLAVGAPIVIQLPTRINVNSGFDVSQRLFLIRIFGLTLFGLV